ncbi:hypothetical protein RZS08_56160, partial [Arthrospira platensis SPKY1]|nr:hypothetical protein [Arthrospira platensis SPKY1]
MMWHGPEIVLEKRGDRLIIERFMVRDGNDSLSLSGSLNLKHLPSKQRGEDGVSINDWEGAWHQLARVGRLRRQLKSVADPLWMEVLLQAGDTFSAVQVR